MTGLDGFNRIAPFYDLLKRCVFGKAIRRSERDGLDAVPNGARVLILGGGTGELLPDLLRQTDGISVCYIDASSAMLRRARNRVDASAPVRFIHGTDAHIPDDEVFDAVIAAYFLDLFPDPTLRRITQDIAPKLRPGGVWIVADFVDGGRWWQRFLLSAMYGFFRRTTGITARRLPDWAGALAAAGMQPVRQRFFWRAFIVSTVYQKDFKAN